MGLPTRGLRMQGIAKIDFSLKSRLVNFWDGFLIVFWRPWELNFLFLILKNTFENRMIFVMKPDPCRARW